MNNYVPINDDEAYSFKEMCHVIRRVITALSCEFPDNVQETIYPGSDLFFLVNDLLGYVNDRIEGQFTMRQGSGKFWKHYEFKYNEKTRTHKRAMKSNLVSLAKSAIKIEEFTGKLPLFANREDVKEMIERVKSNQDIFEREREEASQEINPDYESVDNWLEGDGG